MELERREEADDYLWMPGGHFDQSVVLSDGKTRKHVDPTRRPKKKALAGHATQQIRRAMNAQKIGPTDGPMGTGEFENLLSGGGLHIPDKNTVL
jgi:hypothetical protein